MPGSLEPEKTESLSMAVFHAERLLNSPVGDQGAPPAAARSARRPGNVGRIHRGTAGYRSAHAGRPARRRPRAGDGSATTAAQMNPLAAPSAVIVEHQVVDLKGASRRRCAMASPPLTSTTWCCEMAYTRKPEECGTGTSTTWPAT